MMCRCIYDICMYICIYYIYIICIMAVTENMYQLILGYQIFRQTHTMLCILYIYIYYYVYSTVHSTYMHHAHKIF
jgi:uncharacterized membrane protein